MFVVRTIHPVDKRVEAASFELKPGLEQGETVCSLFREFLAGRPQEFRDRLTFLKKEDIELEWAAAPGGAAFAALFHENLPLSISVLLAGVDESADHQMLGALRATVLEPVMGAEAERVMEAPERPLMMTVLFPDAPELIPTVQLLSTALASVFFRTMLQLSQAAGRA